MSFFSLLLALMLEQGRPLPATSPLRAGLSSWTVSVRGWLGSWTHKQGDGSGAAGWLIWLGVVLPVTLGTAALYWLALAVIGWPLALVCNVAVLYFCLGLRQFSEPLWEIRNLLDKEDWHSANEALAQWSGQPERPLHSAPQLIQDTITYAVTRAHRRIFGVLFWFCVSMLLGAGAAGAVLYRAAEHLRSSSEAAQTAWSWLDWLAVRLTVLGFAVVGHFEAVLAAWRATAGSSSNQSLLLGAAGAALHIDLGDQPQSPSPSTEDIAALINLVWRNVALWLLGLLAIFVFV